MSDLAVVSIATTLVAQSAAATRRIVGSARRLHPSARIVVLAADHGTLGADTGTDEVLVPGDLGLDDDVLARRLGRTSPTQAAAALLPALGRVLLEEYPHTVLVDPAIELLGSLDEIVPTGHEHLRLVPRALTPPPPDGRHPDAVDLAEEGVYLPTLLGVRRGAADVLDWWSDACARRPTERGRLLTMAASWTPHTVCDAPGHGVGPARVDRTTRFGSTADGLTIDDTPVATLDTTGRDQTRPHLFDDTESPRALLGDHPALADVLEARDRDVTAAPPESPDVRTRLYAEALRRHELIGSPAPPPRDSDAFVRWTQQRAEREDGLTRGAQLLWHIRPDLQTHFPTPDLGPHQRQVFVDWIRRDGVAQESIDPELVPPAFETTHDPVVDGVDLAGYVDATSGVGEIARLVGLALDHAGVPTSVQTITGSANRRAHELVPADRGPRHPVEILCVNADRIAGVVAGRARPDDIRTIGVFFWETDVASDTMAPGIAAVDEIWTGSTYGAEVLRRFSDRPVHVLPIPVVVPPPSSGGRVGLGVEGDRPIVLFAYDFHSIARRKNPEGLIEAFRRAVPPDTGPVLVLKSINGDRVPRELERLRWLIRDRADIRIVDGYVDAGTMSAMIETASVYASLHRSEGFGLTIAHAMALGTPVLCTEGSGPADFVDHTTAAVVPAYRTAVGPGAEPYPPDGTWWEPDLDAAAASMHELLTDAAVALLRAERARASIAGRTVAVTADFIAQRLADVPRKRRWRP